MAFSGIKSFDSPFKLMGDLEIFEDTVPLLLELDDCIALGVLERSLTTLISWDLVTSMHPFFLTCRWSLLKLFRLIVRVSIII